MASIFDSLKLSKGAREAIPFFTRAVREGALTTTGILSLGREIGLSYNTQQALDVINVLKGNNNIDRALRLTPANVPIPAELHGSTIGATLNPFSYKVTATGTMFGGPSQIERFVTVTSDTPLSPEQILAKAEAFATGTGRSGGLELESLDITAARSSE